MSQFSGKCDLFDTLMLQKYRTKTGSDDKKDLKESHILYSDELECFTIFKFCRIYTFFKFEINACPFIF